MKSRVSRHLLLILLLFLTLVSLPCMGSSQLIEKASFMLNNQTVTTDALIIDGLYYVPARETTTLIGFKLSWNPSTKVVHFSKNDFSFEIDSSTLKISGPSLIPPGSYAHSFENRIYIPADFASSILGYDIHILSPLKKIELSLGTLSSVVEVKDPALKYALLEKYSPGSTSLTAVDLRFLRSLDLSDLKIERLDGMEAAVYLEELVAKRNKISDISPIVRLPHLKKLILSDNLIQDARNLEFSRGLNTLDLINNSIEDVGFLKNHFNLHNLYLAGNPIIKRSLSEIYYVAKDLVTTDIDLSRISMPEQNTWNLRSTADDFRLTVKPGVFWVPAASFGNSNVTNSETLSNISKDFSLHQSKIKSVYDVAQYLEFRKFDTVQSNQYLGTNSNDRQWLFPAPTDFVMKYAKGSPYSLAMTAAQLLRHNYLETGVLVIIDSQRNEKYYTFVKQNRIERYKDGNYYKTRITPEYGIFRPEAYCNTTASAPENGLKETYDLSAGLDGNVHSVSNLMDFAKARLPERLAIAFTINPAGNGSLPFGKDPLAILIQSQTYFIPNNEGYAHLYQELYDNPDDLLYLKRGPMPKTSPIWIQTE